MKKQVVFIHGWDSKENYIDFFDYLEKFEYKPFEDKILKWKHTFEYDLWVDYEVFMPDMPNKDFCDYEEWKIMFEKVFKYLKNDVIIVWHSIWWTFLLKYLNENNFPVTIKKIFLVAPAFKDSNMEVLGNFNFDQRLTTFKNYEDKTVFYHSKDDGVVPFADLEDFRNILPSAKYNIFENRGHFIDSSFPETINDIKKV